MFGSNILLNYRGKLTFKTQIGAILTVIIGVLGIILTIVFGRDLVTRENPSIEISKKFVNNSEIQYKNITLSMNLINARGVDIPDIHKLIDFDIRKISITQNSSNPYIVTMNFNYTNMKCTPENYNQLYDKALGSGLNNFSMCFNTTFDEYVRNPWSTMNATWITIRLNKCDNRTRPESNKCAPQSRMDSELGDVFIITRFQDHIIQPENYLNPYTNYFNTFTATLSKDLYKVYNYNFKTVDIITDIGLFSVDKKSTLVHELASVDKDIFKESSTNPIQWLLYYC